MASAILKKINGLIWVRNVPAAIEYYTSKLGFETSYESGKGGEIDFAIVDRGGVELHLQHCCCDDERHFGKTFIEVVTDNAKELSLEFEEKGAEIVTPLSEKDWGSSLKVADPEGNWIQFTTYSQ